MSVGVLDLPIVGSTSDTDESKNNELTPVGPVICYRDPADVRTIRRQSRVMLLCFAVTAVAIVGVVYKSIQRPDRIVVDMSSGRTVMINDRQLGATETVRLEKDKLQIADMDYVVKAYLEYIYGVHFLQDLSRGATLILSSLIAGYLFFRSGQLVNLSFKWMVFVLIGGLMVALVGIFESVSLAYPYYSINQRLTHGSARWASIADLKAKGLAHPSGKPLPRGAVRIGRLSSALSPRQYDLILRLENLLVHTGLFGPSNSGKSATFYMNILRDWAQSGSVLVMDIKGELYAHTARYYDHVLPN